MKKIIALLPVLVLLISMFGCTQPSIDRLEPPTIAGTYETQVDLTELVIEHFDTGMGTQSPELSLGSYLSPFTLTLIYEFREDNTYRVSVDSKSIEDSLAHFNTAATACMEELMYRQCREQLLPFGLTVESHDDLLQVLGMTWDEVFQTALGKSEEQFVSDLLQDSFAEVLTAEYFAEGQFLTSLGRLYLSDSLDEEIDITRYERYKTDDGCLVITKAVNIDNADFFSYPYVLTQIAPSASAEAHS